MGKSVLPKLWGAYGRGGVSLDQKKELVRLLVGAMGERAYRPLIEGIADNLIAGGVIVLPCKPGDRVRHLGWDHEFFVNTVELGHKAGTLFRCGNPGTNDYTVFYEDEIGERVIVIGSHCNASDTDDLGE